MNQCFYSSFIFLLNSILCSLYQEYYYSFTFKMLFITSILFHSTQSFFYIDQLAVLHLVLYGMYQIYKKIHYTFYQAIVLTCITLCFIATIVLFYYGYLFKCFCYDPIYSDYYHSLIHYISFVGNSLILIL
jgi:hypothetical protein